MMTPPGLICHLYLCWHVQDFVLIFYWVVCLIIELQVFVICSGYKSFIRFVFFVLEGCNQTSNKNNNDSNKNTAESFLLGHQCQLL